MANNKTASLQKPWNEKFGIPGILPKMVSNELTKLYKSPHLNQPRIHHYWGEALDEEGRQVVVLSKVRIFLWQQKWVDVKLKREISQSSGCWFPVGSKDWWCFLCESWGQRFQLQLTNAATGAAIWRIENLKYCRFCKRNTTVSTALSTLVLDV